MTLPWAVFARHLAASRKPIIVGPWRSEVGFEVLYWLPFLCRFREQYRISRDRLIAIGRGGSADWYDTAGRADLFEHLPVEVVRTLSVQASQQTGSMKQHADEGWERHVCALTALSLGIRDYHVLSPTWMYQRLTPWWTGQQPIAWLDQHLLQPVKLAAPPVPAELAVKLPKSYVAMRWYSRPTWPLHEKSVLWMRDLVKRVAEKQPVVLLTNGFHTDDHADMELGEIPNTFRLHQLAGPMMTYLNNLSIQSGVIAGASAYVGTYGGLAQGAMRWGVPTVALYETFGQTSPAHLALTQGLSLRTGVPFVACRPADIDGALSVVVR